MKKSRSCFSAGKDRWSVRLPETVLIQRAGQYHIEIHDLGCHGEYLKFSSPLTERKKIRKAFPKACLESTSGVPGLFLGRFASCWSLFCLAASVVLFVILQQFVLVVDCQGTDESLRMKILNQFPVPFLFHKGDEQKIRTQIIESTSGDFGWLSVYRNGALLKIRFTDQKLQGKTEEKDGPVVAAKEGMVAYFDVISGEKRVSVNQIVHPGDILIADELDDAAGVTQKLTAKGKVYGYTWMTVKSSVACKETDPLSRGIAFFRLLMDCRNQAAQQLQSDEKISKEKLYLFEQKNGTIDMIVHYTLLEDLTHP